MTQISPMLAVSDGPAAIAFYQKAFGANVDWQLGDGHVVAGLTIDGAQFFLATESPDNGTRSPDNAGHTTVRIELFVDDPVSVQQKAIEAGAQARNPVQRHTHDLNGGQSFSMLQGAVTDPFGHMWLIGKFLT